MNFTSMNTAFAHFFLLFEQCLFVHKLRPFGIFLVHNVAVAVLYICTAVMAAVFLFAEMRDFIPKTAFVPAVMMM